MAKKRWSVKSLFAMLGPGLVTGAADDDPSGIATYSQGRPVRLRAGLDDVPDHTVHDRHQMVAPHRRRRPGEDWRPISANDAKYTAARLGGTLLINNTLNIAADIAAIDALRLVVGGPVLLYIGLFGVGCLTAEILIPYHAYSHYLKALTLVLFAYVATAFTIRIPWGEVAVATFLPQVSWDRDYMLMLVAIFGTTISPYMFFWQASLEAEERKLRARTTSNTAASTAKRFGQREGFRIGLDTTTGMLLSNIIGFFIIVTTAATLHAHGKTHIDTAAQAAEALRPLAGPAAFFLFSLGIIGTGLLAVPVLAGSAGYAVAETFGWEGSLEMPARSAPGFYLVVGAATLAGLGAALTPLDPIRMLFWSAVVNGIVAVPLMIAMMVVVASRSIMGKYAASRALMVFGWFATFLMGLVVAAMLITSVSG